MERRIELAEGELRFQAPLWVGKEAEITFDVVSDGSRFFPIVKYLGIFRTKLNEISCYISYHVAVE